MGGENREETGKGKPIHKIVKQRNEQCKPVARQ
jgi:hypothetical protein